MPRLKGLGIILFFLGNCQSRSLVHQATNLRVGRSNRSGRAIFPLNFDYWGAWRLRLSVGMESAPNPPCRIS